MVVMPSRREEIAVKPFSWSSERYLAMVEAGIMPEGRGIELLDGQLVETMPQGKIHWFIYVALQRVFASLGAFGKGLVVQPTIILGPQNVVDPEFAVLVEPFEPDLNLPPASQILLVVEVSVTSLAYDLNEKKAAYASSGIPEYWVFDGVRSGVWAFSDPRDGQYHTEQFHQASGELTLPQDGGTVSLSSVFPPKS